MIRKGLTHKIAQQFFNKKPDNNVIKPINSKPKNKSYLVQNVIKCNLDKPKLLPPAQDPQKLTVVMEMDEVLAYVFTPD